ncbi:MAG: leucyl aminopeptidase [Sulfuricurvum sp.]|uniref:leucyl aminopeptidase n=1 Tax=Sulfuricurvum sp. TaxID=2025608 RepID=UPI0026319956|nr:leucyl aminopeptidase [Sulfuricurvum sp.]MDD5158766.1 leucyl aminopeptidase [Sulfuricurvum sp.]
MQIVLSNKQPNECLTLLFVTTLSPKSDQTKMLSKAGFSLKEGTTYLDIHHNILYVASRSLCCEDLKISAAKAIQSIQKSSFTTLFIALEHYQDKLDVKALAEGLILGDYYYTQYKHESQKHQERKTIIAYSGSMYTKNHLEELLHEVEIICRNVNFVRDIVNTPPQDYYPHIMALDAKYLAKRDGLECKILGEHEMHEMGMNAILSVGRASVHESHLIHLTYRPKNPKVKIVLLGKGLTYDSGGLSLKSADSMVSMKCDKAGASAVMGVMYTLKALGLACEVHGIIGAVENMIGGNAYKPDDILRAKNGMTIEVKNTDAEGRLVLADCLCYAQDEIEDFDYIFDFSTLTGASIVALGSHTTAVMGHNDTLKNKINTAALQCGELVGFLPYNRYFENDLDSEIADMVNTASSRNGGAITASLFLDRFVKEKNKKKWLHFDMAGAAYAHKAWGYNPYGASGAGVRLIVQFLKNITKESHSKL